MSPQLIIIYNADATIRGKITYAYRKLSSKRDDEPTCAACEITHGGLSFSEAPSWRRSKKELEANGLEVVQWHRDEVETGVRQWARQHGIRYPVVLLRRNRGQDANGIEVAVDSTGLAQCAGDPQSLVQLLKDNGILARTEKPSL